MEGILSLFEVRKGERVLELKKDNVLIGRDPQKCDIVLDPLDLSASRTHCGIARNEKNYILKDLSKNGTWINGERVRKTGQRLYHGDIIEAGNAEITFLLSEANEPVKRLSEAGKNNESLDPSYAIQCYSLAYRHCPTSIEYASKLLSLLEQEGRIEEIITGGAYFNPEEMMKLIDDVRIAAPIARAFVKIGDFVRAMEVIELAGGEYADSRLNAIVENIKHQTGEEVLKTIVKKTPETPFFQGSNLRIYIEERADFVDLRYIERYYKYLEQQIDPLFGGSSESNVVFHVTARDHLFAQSLPDQIIILGYYSPESKRIFIRPRRWMEGRIIEQNFHIVIMHEYVHFRIYDICGGMWLPRWYNEGLALNLSESKNVEGFTNLRSIRDKCKPILLFSDATFSPVYGDPTIAYSQCSAILFYLMLRFGKEKLISVLTTMHESGEDFQNSFESTLGMSLQELDSKWWSVLEGV